MACLRAAIHHAPTVHAVLVRRLHVLVQVDEALEERVVGRVRREVAVVLFIFMRQGRVRRQGFRTP